MINANRIVPVTKTDLLTLVGTILGLVGISYSVLDADDTVGDFTVTASGAAGNLLAAQPVKTLDFADGTTSGTVYFVAAYDFAGFAIAGAAAEAEGAVISDASTLYKAVLADSAITVTAISPVIGD